MPTVKPTEYAHLSDEQVAELGRELDAIRQRVLDERGAADADYIRRIVKIQRRLELAGQVRDLRTGEVHGDEGQLIQTCISAAAGPVHLEI